MAQYPNKSDIYQDKGTKLLSSDSSLGMFTVVAMILLFWGYCWLKSYSPLFPPQRINVIFKEVAGLSENANVFVDGVHVGAVDKMEWQKEHHVLVRLRIDTSILKVPVGAKYVQVDMPQVQPGEAPLPPLTDEVAVKGEDPIRPELAVNKLAITLSDIDMKQVGRDFKADRLRLLHASDQLAILADKSMPVIDRAAPLEDDVKGMTKDLRRVSRKLADMFDDPHFASDLQETAREAKETAQTIKAAIHELNVTLGDKPLRHDLLQSLQQLNQSTANVAKSLDSLQQVTADKSLRSDLKQILQEAHSTLSMVNEIASKPMGSNLRGVLQKA